MPIIENDIPESLGYIQTSSEKMDSLLKGLLTLSRMGRIEVNMIEIDMNKFISSIMSAHDYQIKELNIKVIQEILPSCTGDEDLLNQVFSNLLENSMKFLDPGRPGIIKFTGETKQNNSVYCVEDNGIGILSKYQKKIFQIFHKLNKEKSGDGMGLSIVKNIIDKHSGDIWIDSEKGKGTKFYISIPNKDLITKNREK